MGNFCSTSVTELPDSSTVIEGTEDDATGTVSAEGSDDSSEPDGTAGDGTEGAS